MYSTVGRRQAILDALMYRRRDTVSNLAAEFSVTERTIRRDIDILSNDYPIYTEQGHGGGVRVRNGFYTDHRHLTATESDLLRRLAATASTDDKSVIDGILATFGSEKESA